MDVIISVLVLIGTGLFAFITFILAEHKEEIWNHIEFKDGDNNIN